MNRDSSSDSLTKLHRLLVDHFDLDELRTLCFHLSVDFDTLCGEEKSAKARELITVMLRENRLAELAGKVQALRSNVDWPNVETLSPEERLAWTLDEVYVPLKARPLPRKEKKDLTGLEDLSGLREPLSIADVMRRLDPPHLAQPGAGQEISSLPGIHPCA